MFWISVMQSVYSRHSYFHVSLSNKNKLMSHMLSATAATTWYLTRTLPPAVMGYYFILYNNVSFADWYIYIYIYILLLVVGIYTACCLNLGKIYWTYSWWENSCNNEPVFWSFVKRCILKTFLHKTWFKFMRYMLYTVASACWYLSRRLAPVL